MLRELAISETGFVFDPRTGATYSVNPTGLVVLQGLREGMNGGAIAASISEKFGVSVREAEVDLSDFVQTLRQYALVPAE